MMTNCSRRYLEISSVEAAERRQLLKFCIFIVRSYSLSGYSSIHILLMQPQTHSCTYSYVELYYYSVEMFGDNISDVYMKVTDNLILVQYDNITTASIIFVVVCMCSCCQFIITMFSIIQIEYQVVSPRPELFSGSPTFPKTVSHVLNVTNPNFLVTVAGSSNIYMYYIQYESKQFCYL